MSEETTEFKDLGLAPPILEALTQKGYEHPTLIQQKAIPTILEKKDLIGSAPTGTGKTAAFALPTLSLLNDDPSRIALVLAPTRELALQCDENFKAYSDKLSLKVAVIYGGVGYNKQLQLLEDKPNVIIATPGRLLDHVENRRIDLKKVGILILDEVDRMLDMGFIDDVRTIVSKCPKERQTLMFSATIPDKIKDFAKWALNDPVTVDAGTRRMPSETIDHAIYPIDSIQKSDLLLSYIKQIEYQSVIVFTRTKRDTDRVASWLTANQLNKVAVIHADRSQKEREAALKGFKDGTYDILVATDVASRGLDVNGISHVVNYNVPEHAEDYVHRIGRTGRASRQGEAITLFSGEEYSFLVAIERYIGSPIKQKKLEGFAYRREPVIRTDSAPKPGGGFGKRGARGTRRGGLRSR